MTRRQTQYFMGRHENYLEQLIHNLDKVGEDPKQIKWIMRDGIYMPQDTLARNKLCDLVMAYWDNEYSLIELKGSRSKRGKAIQQLQSGEELVRNNFQPVVNLVKKVVYYSPEGYEWETIR